MGLVSKRLKGADGTSAALAMLRWFESNPPHQTIGKVKNAGIAQLVEHLTCNQRVAGSSPVPGSKNAIYG